jgi:hypothetical protein
MTIPDTWPPVLHFLGPPLVIEPSAGQLFSDAGLLPICALDERIVLTWAFTDALDDPRDPGLTEHISWRGCAAGSMASGPARRSRTNTAPWALALLQAGRGPLAGHGRSVRRGGHIDLRAQADIYSARRTHRPRHSEKELQGSIRFYLLVTLAS